MEKEVYCIRVRLNGMELEKATKYLANEKIVFFVKDEFSYLEIESFLKVMAKMTKEEAKMFTNVTGITNITPEI